MRKILVTILTIVLICSFGCMKAQFNVDFFDDWNASLVLRIMLLNYNKKDVINFFKNHDNLVISVITDSTGTPFSIRGTHHKGDYSGIFMSLDSIILNKSIPISVRQHYPYFVDTFITSLRDKEYERQKNRYQTNIGVAPHYGFLNHLPNFIDSTDFATALEWIDFSLPYISDGSNSVFTKQRENTKPTSDNYNQALLFKYLTFTIGQYETGKLIETNHLFEIETDSLGIPLKLLSVSPESAEIEKLRTLFDKLFILNTQAFDTSESSTRYTEPDRRIITVNFPGILLNGYDQNKNYKFFTPYFEKFAYSRRLTSQILTNRFKEIFENRKK